MLSSSVKCGDVVQLISGGPKMTVVEVLDQIDAVAVIWFNANLELETMNLSFFALKQLIE